MLQKKRMFGLLLNRSVLCLVMIMMTGCHLMPYSMQPTQLRKLNRGRELGRDTSNFSIKDPAIPLSENKTGKEVSDDSL